MSSPRPMPRCALLALLLLAASCASTPQRPAPLCAAGPAPTRGAPPQTAQWLRLLLHGYDGSPQFTSRPLQDCTGTPLLWAEDSAACEEVWRYGEPLAPAPLGEADLVRTPLGPGRWLAWVIARRYTSGEGLGPVALVEEGPRGLEVRALGTLRALTTRPRLRLERVGTLELLVAEGESCPRAAPAPCERAAVVMPRRGLRFISEPVTDSRGACVGPGVFYLERRHVERLRTGWERRYALRTTLDFTPAGLVVHEQLVVSDADPRQPGVPPRLFQRAQGERSIRMLAAGMRSDERSLWGRVVQAPGDSPVGGGL